MSRSRKLNQLRKRISFILKYLFILIDAHLAVLSLLLSMTAVPRRSWIFLCMGSVLTCSTENAVIAVPTVGNVSLKITRFCRDTRIRPIVSSCVSIKDFIPLFPKNQWRTGLRLRLRESNES